MYNKTNNIGARSKKESKMKVLEINSVCGIRSTGRICTDIAEVLEKNGHQCKIAYGREEVPRKYQRYAIRIGNSMSVKVHALESRVLDNAGLGSKKSTRKFLKQIDDFQPDIIHLHNLHGYYLNIVELFEYLKANRIPVVWTLHDCWGFTGHCAYFDYIKCEKWKKDGCNHCKQKSRYPKSYLMDNSYKNYTIKKKIFCNLEKMQLISPSYWLAELVKESFLKEYPIHVIPNGIDLEIFSPTKSNFRKKYGLERKKILLGVASNWEGRKGIKDFIHLSKIIDNNYKIVLVGVSDRDKEKLPINILGINKTNNPNELAEIYTAADVFINPTYEDNFPTTNLEALACGTPVITYNTGGSVESINKNNGLIVEKGNISQLYSAIKTIDSRNFDIKLRKEWDKNYSYQKYLKIYEELL